MKGFSPISSSSALIVSLKLSICYKLWSSRFCLIKRVLAMALLKLKNLDKTMAYLYMERPEKEVGDSFDCLAHPQPLTFLPR